jgi:hypothetical protein
MYTFKYLRRKMKNITFFIKVNVKVTLEMATNAQRGSRGIALFFNFGARWGASSTPRPGRFTPRKDPVPIVQEAG